MKRPRRPPTTNKVKRAPGMKRSYIPEAPIVRIVLTHKLSGNESAAALDILVTSRKAAGLPTPDWIEERPPLDFDAADDRASKQTDLTRAYSKWRTDLRDTVCLRVADAVLFHERSLGDVDEANHWQRGVALGHLTVALRHFAFLRGNAPRDAAREWRYKAA